jgi:hypothetical protein
MQLQHCAAVSSAAQSGLTQAQETDVPIFARINHSLGISSSDRALISIGDLWPGIKADRHDPLCLHQRVAEDFLSTSYDFFMILNPQNRFII